MPAFPGCPGKNVALNGCSSGGGGGGGSSSSSSGSSSSSSSNLARLKCRRCSYPVITVE